MGGSGFGRFFSERSAATATAALRSCTGAASCGTGSSIRLPISRHCQRAGSALPSAPIDEGSGLKKKSLAIRQVGAPMRYACPSTLDGGSSSPSTSGFHVALVDRDHPRHRRIEHPVAAHRFPVAVEREADELALRIEHGRA